MCSVGRHGDGILARNRPVQADFQASAERAICFHSRAAATPVDARLFSVTPSRKRKHNLDRSGVIWLSPTKARNNIIRDTAAISGGQLAASPPAVARRLFYKLRAVVSVRAE